MPAYSVDLRERIVRRYEDGGQTQAEIAEDFEVCPRTVGAYLSQWRRTGSLAPEPHHGGPAPKLDEQDRKRIKQIVQDESDITLEALCTRLDNKVSRPTMWRTLRKMGVRYKKNPARQ